MEKPVKIVLGIDPGTVIMGYSIIAVEKNKIAVLAIDVLNLSSKKDNYERLQLIYQKVIEIVKQYKPHEMAIEAPFFGKNVQSMLKLGRAQGVAIAAAMSTQIPIVEYPPKRIKQSITGNGNADKEQVWKMLTTIVDIVEKPKYFDATDALAVAVCHHFSGKVPVEKTPAKKASANPWEKFIKENPGRIKTL